MRITLATCTNRNGYRVNSDRGTVEPELLIGPKINRNFVCHPRTGSNLQLMRRIDGKSNVRTLTLRTSAER